MMKKKFTLLAAALMASMVISTSAEPVKVGNLYYEILDETAKTAEIVAPPSGTPYQNVQNGWFAKSVTINGESYTVETVGEGAFEGASFSPYANSSGVATFYMIAVPMKVIKKDAFKDITARTDGNVGLRFTTNVCTGNVTGSSMLTSVEPGAFRGAHIRGFVATGGSGGYSHTTAFSNGATGLYNTNTNTIICAPADMRADASMGSGGTYGGYATSATFNSAALAVADYAFWGNTRLKTITMNEGLTTIGQQAFHGMTALQTVNIPSTVTTIASDAFEGCTAIANLTCNLTTPPNVVFEDDVYDRIRESGNITVPAGSEAAYQADANWKKFWTAPVAAPKMFIAGTFTDNWANPLEMTENDGVYTITVNGVQQGDLFKFIEGEGNDAVWYGGNADGNTYGVHPDWCTGIALSDTGQNFEITSGSGDLTFTIDANKNLSITGWAAPANELYLAGSMTNWATDKEAMTLDDQTGKFSITRQMEAGAEFKFIDQDGTWIGGDANGTFVVNRDQVVNATELSLILNGGNNFQIPIAGTWTLTVDKQTMKLVIAGNWPAPKYAVVVAECDHGTVVADKDEAEEGETVTVTPTPDPGCELTSLEVIAGANTPVETYYDNETGKFTFEMPAEIVSIVAVFDYTVDAITLAQALTQPDGTEVRISDELLIATVEPDGFAILTDNNGNWIASHFDNDVINALVSLTPPAKSIKAGTLQGIITNLDTNPELELSFAPEAGESNVDFTPANIDLTQPIDVPGNCIATVSGYYADGKLRAYSNVEDPGQMLTIDNTYVGEALNDTKYVDHQVNLKVIVKLNDAWEANEPSGARRVHKDDGNSSSNYTIVPVTGSVSEDIVTAVADLRVAETGTVTYVNVMGQTSNVPFQGVNIVIRNGKAIGKVVK